MGSSLALLLLIGDVPTQGIAYERATRTSKASACAVNVGDELCVKSNGDADHVAHAATIARSLRQSVIVSLHQESRRPGHGCTRNNTEDEPLEGLADLPQAAHLRSSAFISRGSCVEETATARPARHHSTAPRIQTTTAWPQMNTEEAQR
jgi:hypothetical protein